MATTLTDITRYMSSPPPKAHNRKAFDWTPGTPHISPQWCPRSCGFSLREKPPKPKNWDRMPLERQVAYVQREIRQRSPKAAARTARDLANHLRSGGALSSRTAGADLIQYLADSSQGTKKQFEATLAHLSKLYPLKLSRIHGEEHIELVMNPVQIPFENKTLIFGPFLVQIPLTRSSLQNIKFKPCSTTPIYSRGDNDELGTIHPHIQEYGIHRPDADSTLCFGDEQGLAESAMRSKDIFSLVNSIEQVLKTYNPHSPYFRPEQALQQRAHEDHAPIKCPLCKTVFQHSGAAVPTCRCLRNKYPLRRDLHITDAWEPRRQTAQCPKTEGMNRSHYQIQPPPSVIKYSVLGQEMEASGHSLPGHFIDKNCPEGAELITGLVIQKIINKSNRESAEAQMATIAEIQRWINRPEDEWLTCEIEPATCDEYGEYDAKIIKYKTSEIHSPHPAQAEEESDQWIDWEVSKKEIANQATQDLLEMLQKAGIAEPTLQVPEISTPVTGEVITEQQLIDTVYPGEEIEPSINTNPTPAEEPAQATDTAEPEPQPPAEAAPDAISAERAHETYF